MWLCQHRLWPSSPFLLICSASLNPHAHRPTALHAERFDALPSGTAMMLRAHPPAIRECLCCRQKDDRPFQMTQQQVAQTGA